MGEGKRLALLFPDRASGRDAKRTQGLSVFTSFLSGAGGRYMKLQGKSGICRGSSYSFTTEYYKEELLWIINDPHGIGIVLLAGIEKLALESFLQS